MNDLAVQFRELDANLAQRELERPDGPARAASGRVLALRPRRCPRPRRAPRAKKPPLNADTVVMKLRLQDLEPTLEGAANGYASDLETLDDEHVILLSP